MTAEPRPAGTLRGGNLPAGADRGSFHHREEPSSPVSQPPTLAFPKFLQFESRGDFAG
jgi:hypothetical protein